MTCNAFFRVTASERNILRPRLTWKLSLFCPDISAHVANSGKSASSEGISAADLINRKNMAVPAPELLMHFTAGEKAAPKEAVDYIKEKGVASLKVLPVSTRCKH